MNCIQSLHEYVLWGNLPNEAIKHLSQFVDKKFKNAKARASALVMTEQAYFSSVSQKDCFNDFGVEKFKVLSTLDNKTSEICRTMDGKVFPMSEFLEGTTAPPFHVRCRSITIPYFNHEFTAEKIIDAKGKDEKTYHVPSDMTYEDWEKGFIDGDKSGIIDNDGISNIEGAVSGSASNKLIPGSPGLVTGGSSKKLGKNMMEEMGLPRNTSHKGYQAQHIIPSEVSNHPVIQKIGMNLDDASNGMFLRNNGSTPVSTMSRHEGYHSTYNNAVKNELDKIDVNNSISKIEMDVFNLQSNLKTLQKNGLPLYPKHGATVELWEKILLNLKNKRRYGNE